MSKFRSFLQIVSLVLIACLMLNLSGAQAAGSPGTAFTYQGQLRDGSGNPITNTCDFQFGLYAALSGGSVVAGTTVQTVPSVAVTNGYFTVSLDFGAGAFDGNARWLEIGVSCPAGGSYMTLSPRQALTASPYAIYAVNAGTAASFSGPLAGDVTGSQGSTTVAKLQGQPVAATAPTSGQVLQYDGTQWAPTTPAFWRLGGNSGTNPSTNYLGTSDSQPLELRVSGQRVLRLEPITTAIHGFAPNLLGGYGGNSITPGASGVTIAGGGKSGWLNRVTDDFGTIGGGLNNQAGDNTGDFLSAPAATVGGGSGNKASGDAATVSGGWGNTASSAQATVGGGQGNTASSALATVGGGQGNTASGNYATVPGGYNASATHFGEQAYASGSFTSAGDAQASDYVLRNWTTDAAQTELYLDGSAQRLTLAPGRGLSFDILITAHATTGPVAAGYQIKGLIDNDSGNTRFIGTPTVTVLGEDVPAWNVVVVADNTNDALVIKVTGAASSSIKWVASVRTAQVGW